jgi:excisionase family DNA binding protein
MAKKYLSLQEAADLLGISQEKLKQARSDGDIRGFADRGNWKFRQEDIDEYGRTVQMDSSPEVPLMDVDDSNVLDDEDQISEQPTIIRKQDEDSNIFSDDDDLEEGASDSGVRLVLDSKLINAPLGDSGEDVLTDSSVDIPLSLGDSDDELALDDEGSSEGVSVSIPVSLSDSSEDGLVLEDDDDESLDLSRSDSDVRLAVDLDNEEGSAVILSGADSDSDVRLLDQTQPMILEAPDLGLGPDSDSDVAMVNTGSDSDVKLPSDGEGVSAEDLSLDSDVRLIKTDSDSDVRLQTSNSDSDVRLLSPAPDLEPNSDSDVSLIDHTDGGIDLTGDNSDVDIVLDDDSGIALDIGTESDISLEVAEDSGLSLDIADDSGIALDIADDSGIALDVGTDSDISLAADADSGLSLDIGADSGISLDAPTDSGISLDADDLAATAPAMSLGEASNESAADTMVQMSAFDGVDDEDDESDFELGALEGDSSSDTSVLLFDDEDEEADDRAATMIKKKGADSEETFDLDAGEVFDEEFEDDDELLGEDDEIEDFADDEEFMADEDDFDDSFSSEEGAADFVAPAAAGGGVMRGPVEQEWGMGVFACVLVTSILMLVCSGVTFDLVRYVWQAGEPGVVAGPMIDMMGIK